jgi:hypothetical protein
MGNDTILRNQSNPQPIFSHSIINVSRGTDEDISSHFSHPFILSKGIAFGPKKVIWITRGLEGLEVKD